MFSRPWTVMSRNIYVGADVAGPLSATSGLTETAAVDALGHANHALLKAAVATDFAVRGRLLAREIKAAGPDLIGLQEVAIWRRGPINPSAIGTLDADEIIWDFLAILLAELKRCGTAYEVGHQFEGADVEAPAFTGSVIDGSAVGHDLRLTMRDVILVRADRGITVTHRQARAFTQRLEVEVAEQRFSFAHGIAWVDVERGGDRLRFATTHLDSESSDIARAQAHEVLGAVRSDEGRPVVVVGDFNSDPDDQTVRAVDPLGTPGSGPYMAMIEAGYLDCVASVGVQSPTFGFQPGLLDDDASGFAQRIDFVFASPPEVSVSSASTTGISTDSRDPASGLWPSDHAGVVVTLT